MAVRAPHTSQLGGSPGHLEKAGTLSQRVCLEHLFWSPIDPPKGYATLFSAIEEAINIGRQIPNCEVWILDSKGKG